MYKLIKTNGHNLSIGHLVKHPNHKEVIVRDNCLLYIDGIPTNDTTDWGFDFTRWTLVRESDDLEDLLSKASEILKVGDWVKVKDTSHVRRWTRGAEAIGHVFQIKDKNSLDELLQERATSPDGNNKFGINYFLTDLEVCSAPSEASSTISTSSKFQTGDYVTIIKSGSGTAFSDIGKTFKIIEAYTSRSPSFVSYNIKLDRKKDGNRDEWTSEDALRKATTEEIEKQYGKSKPAAEVQTEFKKDDYIVINGGIVHDQFKLNHIFKQKENERYIRPYVDSLGSVTNSWSSVKFDKTGDTSWRFATPEEIAMYDAAGKPVDVTKVPECPFKKGDWVYVVQERPDCGKYGNQAYAKVGTVFQTTTNGQSSDVFKGHWWIRGAKGDSDIISSLLRKAEPHEIPTAVGSAPLVTTSQLPGESDLDYARRMYPIGTKFIGIYRLKEGKKEECTVTRNDHYSSVKSILVSANRPAEGVKEASTFLKYNGEWSEIISSASTPVEPALSLSDLLLKEATERFPSGCSYIGTDGTTYKNVEGTPQWFNSTGIMLARSKGLVYRVSDNKWAKLIEQPKTSEPVESIIYPEYVCITSAGPNDTGNLSYSKAVFKGYIGKISRFEANRGSDKTGVYHLEPGIVVYKKYCTAVSEQEYLDYHKKVTPAKLSGIEVIPGIYIGDIVVSLTKGGTERYPGDMFKILSNSAKGKLYYKPNIQGGGDCRDWRLATTEEVAAYHAGKRNISEISPSAIADAPKSNIGRRVRILPSYHACGYSGEGTIIKDKYYNLFTVRLDSGVECCPYRPGEINAQCEFIDEPHQSHDFGQKSTACVTYDGKPLTSFDNPTGDYYKQEMGKLVGMDVKKPSYSKAATYHNAISEIREKLNITVDLPGYMMGVDPVSYEPPLISLDDDIELIPHKEERHMLITLD